MQMFEITTNQKITQLKWKKLHVSLT